jgi:ornithine decarboxylase
MYILEFFGFRITKQSKSKSKNSKNLKNDGGLKRKYSTVISNTLALSYFRISKRALETQINLWRKQLPTIVPHYAVKCNNDPVLMQWMTEIYPDIGFDCASDREITEVLPICNPEKIVYAQPCKKAEDIRIAQARGISRTVADSVEEVEKLAEAGWSGEVLVRLLVADQGSKQPFSKKFGAPHAWLPKMYDAAKSLNINMVGFSFHVGSECEIPKQYRNAIIDCKIAQEQASKYGFDLKVMDIGGGFLPNRTSFEDVANEIRLAKVNHLPDAKIEWIAEPGRFLAGPTHTLYTTVIGKKPVWPEPEIISDPEWRVTIDESVYGCFSNIPFDHQKPVLERLRKAIHGERRTQTIIFGRTCDSGDCIGTMPMLDVKVGDVLVVRNMGAYTTVTASEFNGFPKPGKIYETNAKYMNSANTNRC